jgi:hypothetical protein
MDELTRFARRLVEQLNTSSEGVHRAIPVAALRETVIPYRKHRRALGVESVEDYETLLVRLVAGERGYLKTVPAAAAERCRSELAQATPDLAVLDEVAGATVQITSMIGGVSGTGEDGGDGEDSEVGEVSVINAVSPVMPVSPAGEGTPGNEVRATRGFKGATGGRTPSSTPIPPAAPSTAPTPSTPVPMTTQSATQSAASSPSPVSTPSTCQHCDHAIPAGRQVVFCPWCGQRLIPFTCARCNTELDSEWRHCITCGAEVKDPFRYA